MLKSYCCRFYANIRICINQRLKYRLDYLLCDITHFVDNFYKINKIKTFPIGGELTNFSKHLLKHMNGLAMIAATKQVEMIKNVIDVVESFT